VPSVTRSCRRRHVYTIYYIGRKGWLKIKRLSPSCRRPPRRRVVYIGNNISIVCVCRSAGWPVSGLCRSPTSRSRRSSANGYIMLLSGQELWAVSFLRKSKGPSSEKGNRTTLFDVHPYNKIYNILYMVPIQWSLLCIKSLTAVGHRRSLCLKPIWIQYYCACICLSNIII